MSYLLAAARTPMGKFLGTLASQAAPQLAAVAIRAALERAGIAAEQVDEVVLGHVISAGVGQAPARQAMLSAGIPDGVPALTINKVCGSGLAAVMLADQAIRAGDARIVVAGGMESMSRAPHLIVGAREGWKYGPQTVLDALQHDGLRCSCEGTGMGEIADWTASCCGATREAQDSFAAESHRRAVAAIEQGLFDREIAPVTVKTKGGETQVARDEGARSDTSAATLAKLRPAFGASGTVTAGNASQLSDGAAALVVVDEGTRRASRPSGPVARIVATATFAGPPKELFTAPIGAVRKVVERAGLSLADIDLYELNEAFAAQCLACLGPLEIPADKVNVHGGAIALGHPIGASGARVLVTLLHALATRGLHRGIAALCLGGGEGVAMLIERES